MEEMEFSHVKEQGVRHEDGDDVCVMCILMNDEWIGGEVRHVREPETTSVRHPPLSLCLAGNEGN